MRTLQHELRLFLLALQFLTRLPVPARVGFQPQWLSESVRHFPAVGMFVGLWASTVLVLSAQLWSPWVAAMLSLAATLCLTGGLHEDGLADTADALGGSSSREKALAIMKDSRIGAYGAMALVVVLGLKVIVLADLIRHDLGVAALLVIGAHTVSRTAAVVLMWALPYAGAADQAKARPLAQEVSAHAPLVALAWTALVLVWLSWSAASVLTASALLLGLVAATGVLVLCGRWWHRRLGGFTGDTLGATQQLTEIGSLLAALAVLNHPWPFLGQ